MFCKEYYYLFIIYCSFKLVSCLRLHTNSRLSGFVLVDNNFTYVEELVPGQIDIATDPNSNGVPENRQDAYNPNERDVVSHAKANVRFEPSVLYFKDKVVGNSYRETVYIYNTSQNKTLRMEKIAGGKHSQIQIAAFGDELVAPGGNTTFDIMFIGKDLVPLSTHYYIYTSKGILKYDVVSWCTENPYNISPMSEITLPLNSTYSHPITLRNPFSEPLQITEALLHGGTYASHTLPPGIDFENAVDLWTIQPYETKEILRVHFLTYEAWNLTTFQSIKLATGTTLLIPVEVEVTPRTGLYVPGNKLDFETGGHLDPPAVRPLHLCSSARKPVTIESVSCEPRFEGCEVLEFRPTALPPWSCGSGPVAKVKFAWNAYPPGEITTGGLLIKNDLDPFFRVNYTARIHHGGLTYNSSLTHYVTGIPSFNSSPRPFAFTNEYRELLAVMNVYLSFEAAEYFQIRGFEPYVLKPHEKKVLFNLQTRKGVKLSELKLDSSILLETNISTIRLPLRVYDGLLTKLSKVAPSSLHVGLVSAKTTIVTYFGLSNSNPETIFVKYFGCNDTSVRIELLDVKPGNAKTFYYRSFLNESGMVHSGGFNIHPYHYASFKLAVNTSDNEEEVYAEVWVQSEYQRLIFPLYMNVAKGFIRVSPNPFEFEDCFPGAYCMQQLTVESHFEQSMSIVNISTIPYTPYDKLLFYPNVPAVIAGHSTSIVGNVLWEPTIDASQAWPLGYLGLPNNKTGRDRWLGTIERPNITRDFDLTLMESQYLRYREQYTSPIDLTFRMDTTEMRNYLFKGRIQLQWPQIVTSRVVDFPLVQIGTVSYENISIFNPMHSHYMTVQAIMAQHYQQEVPTVVGTMISDYEEPGGIESKSNEFFLDVNVESPYRQNVLNGTKRRYTNHRSSVVFVLPPQSNTTIRIGFSPTSQVLTTTRLYLRNDFTILDSVAISGAGAYPQLTLEGLESTTTNLIRFVIPYETLRLCEENNNRVLNITTKKVFRLHNTGQVSVQIFGFTINGSPCQGYGFKITNCHNTPFVLKPGMSKRIEIAYTPDFTAARVQSSFCVESDMKTVSVLTYTLYAALDPEWLRRCKPHFPRPQWEPTAYYTMIGLFFFLLIAVAVMAVYDQSSYTKSLVNDFEEAGPKITPLHNLKSVESCFAKASVPHHHHNHHHQRGSTSRSSDIASNKSPQKRNAHNPSFDFCSDPPIVSLDDMDSRPKVRMSTPSETSTNKPTLLQVSASKLSLASSSSSSHSSSVTSSPRTKKTGSPRCTSSDAGMSSDRRGGVRASPNSAHQRSLHNDNSEAESDSVRRRNKKNNFDEIGYKSPWIKKKEAKLEEKRNTTKLLKNTPNNKWSKINTMKNGPSNISSEWPPLPSMGTAEPVVNSTTAFSSSNAYNIANNSNVKSNNKDSGLRKTESNNKVGGKKSTNVASATTAAASGPTQASTGKTDKSPKKRNTHNPSFDFCSDPPIASLNDIEVPRARMSTPPEKSTSKLNLLQKAYLAAENTGYRHCINATKLLSAVKSNITEITERTNQSDVPSTAQNSTSLPRNRGDFETLSSLCTDMTTVKPRRRGNARRRAREERMVNTRRSTEISIGLTAPETLDRKAQMKNASVEEEEKIKEQKIVQQALATSAAKNRTEAQKRNGITPDSHMMTKASMLNGGWNPSTVDEETRMLNAHKMSSTNSYLHGELYSRVLAQAPRSRPSSSSSDSCASFESSKATAPEFYSSTVQSFPGIIPDPSTSITPESSTAMAPEPSAAIQAESGKSMKSELRKSLWDIDDNRPSISALMYCRAVESVNYKLEKNVNGDSDEWFNDYAYVGPALNESVAGHSLFSVGESTTSNGPKYRQSTFNGLSYKQNTPSTSVNLDQFPTFVGSEENGYLFMGDSIHCNEKLKKEDSSKKEVEYFKFEDGPITAPLMHRKRLTTMASLSKMENSALDAPSPDIANAPTIIKYITDIWCPANVEPSGCSRKRCSLSRLLRVEDCIVLQENIENHGPHKVLKNEIKAMWNGHHQKQE